MKLEIVSLTQKNKSQAIEFLKTILKHSEFSEFEPDENKAGKLLDNCIKKNAEYKCTLAMIDKREVVGALIAVKTETWFSKFQLITDYLIYVDPYFRKYGIGILLIEDLKNWARKMAVNRVIVHDNFKQKNDEFEKFITSCGFKKVGSGYQWAVTPMTN